MATRRETVDFVVEQMAGAGHVSARAMFGEYGVYCDGRVVALICGDQLFVKPTAAGRAFIGTPEEAPPYRGAKPSFLISADGLEDGEWLAELIRLTTAELPLPKPKKAKAQKA
ncbi:MAG: TfoX/Sxy family protein, partial [Sphingomonadales bacterium]|nr:TfoX/Sxy family protein [Sphingomonadales bacterium]